ncbi:hypothetical protein K438DRAFT_1197192 [Mycena galopus ATCC 62051]|nr:hypothetical protein K438DRAFT_1197192 [Mycena galopus ATCC 62051]
MLCIDAHNSPKNRSLVPKINSFVEDQCLMVARFFKVALAPHRAVCGLERCVLRWRDADASAESSKPPTTPTSCADHFWLSESASDMSASQYRRPHRYSQDRGCLKRPLVVIVLSEEEKVFFFMLLAPCSSVAYRMISVWIAVCVPFIQSQVQTRNPQRITRMLLSELAKLDSDAQEDSSALFRPRTRGRGEKRDGRASGSGGGGGAGVRERAWLPQWTKNIRLASTQCTSM